MEYCSNHKTHYITTESLRNSVIIKGLEVLTLCGSYSFFSKMEKVVAMGVNLTHSNQSTRCLSFL